MPNPTPARDPALTAEAHALCAAFEPFATLAALHAAPEWPAWSARLGALLADVRHTRAEAPPPSPSSRTVRLVQWNIEHGNRFVAVQDALASHPALAGADLVTLNEVDLGMARSGNRDVLGELATALGRHAAWAPLFLETTAGRFDDTGLAEGQHNHEGLFGLGLLSRWPLREVRLVEMPSPEAYQFDVERMLGRHIAMIAAVDRPGAPFIAVAVHLEVHRTREHRAVQMRTLLEGLADDVRPTLIAGDFNSHTFNRGRAWDPLWGAAALMFAPQRALEHRLLFPDQGRHHEPLFDELARAGFRWNQLVDHVPTLQLRFDRIDELRAFPDFAQQGVRAVLAWAERRGKLRLDWFAARGFPEGRGYTVHGLSGYGLASDHAPIVCELW